MMQPIFLKNWLNTTNVPSHQLSTLSARTILCALSLTVEMAAAQVDPSFLRVAPGSPTVGNAYLPSELTVQTMLSIQATRIFEVSITSGEMLIGVSAPAFGDEGQLGTRRVIAVPPMPAGSYPIRFRDYGGNLFPSTSTYVVAPTTQSVTIVSMLFSQPPSPETSMTNPPGIRYFLTTQPSDVSALLALNHLPDQFQRTYSIWPLWRIADPGFRAWPATGDAPATALPVCRFFSPQFSTHFYSAKPEECALLKSLPTQWNDEGTAFRALLPTAGICGYGTEPVYRLFSAEFKNHRYTVQADTYRAMSLAGWVGEGVAFCSPLN